MTWHEAVVGRPN